MSRRHGPLTEPHAGSAMPAGRGRTAVRRRQLGDQRREDLRHRRASKALVDSQGFIVVWATIDPTAGRAGVRPFVVEAGPAAGLQRDLARAQARARRQRHRLRPSRQDCRIPFGNILGSPEIQVKTTEGFKGAMATFDASRPLVAASALGVARATLESLKDFVQQKGITIRYGLPRSRMTNLERELVEMEVMLRSAWLLVLKAVWMMDERKPNNLEASMSKVRAGDVVVKITQRAVELLGPYGLSRESLLEKWFRDAKINDLYEGTGQINRLIVARRILDYSRHELA